MAKWLLGKNTEENTMKFLETLIPKTLKGTTSQIWKERVFITSSSKSGILKETWLKLLKILVLKMFT